MEEKNQLLEILKVFSDPRLFEHFIHYFNVFEEYSKEKVITSNRIYAVEDFNGKTIQRIINELPYLRALQKKNKKFFNDVLERFVTKYKGHIYHPKGLYSEQIFGPVFNYQCQCGYYNNETYRDKICPICKVKCTNNIERYKSIGFIELPVPIINPLFMFTINKIVNMSDLNKLVQSKNEPHQTFSQILLFDLTTQKFVIPPELPLFEIPKLYLELQSFDKPSKYYLDYILEKSLQDGIINNKTVERVKSKYHNEVVVFGWYSLIKAIFHDDILPIFLNANKNIFTNYPQILRHLFLFLVPVTAPETRPIVTIDNQQIIPQITKILQSIVTISSRQDIIDMFEDNIKREKENIDYQAYIKNPVMYLYNFFKKKEETETVKDMVDKELYASRLQFLVKNYYSYIIDNELKGKEGRIRSELIGKTIDFSSRNVITPTLEIKPYEILISYHTAKKTLLPEFINFVYMLSKRVISKQKPNELNPELYKSDFKVFNDKEKKEKLRSVFKIFHKEGYSINLTEDEKNRLKDEIFNLNITYIDIIQLLFEILYNPARYQTIPTEIKDIIDTLFDFFIYNINNDVIDIRALINRQPTLWIYSIIGYKVKVNINKNDYTMKIHPLIVESFNADFDGDSFKAKISIIVKDKKLNKIHKIDNIDIENLKDLEL